MAEYEYVSGPKRKPNGKKQSITKHRAIWIEKHGEIPEGMVIHHKNGDKKDNRIENLEMVSHLEHRKKHITLKGKSSHNQIRRREA